jgi:hypothetical protein
MPSISCRRFLAVAACAALLAPAGARAQLISPKTIPVAEGDQFLLYPAKRVGMAEVSIALADTLGDPFVNPARGAALLEGVVFAAPTHYNVTEGDGNGITLPVGGLWTGDRWFGALSVALQQIGDSDPEPGPGWGCPVCLSVLPRAKPLSEGSSNNLYSYVSLGRRFGGGRTAVAASASRVALEAVDGVDLLYASSQRIDQEGDISDFRLGLTHQLDGGGSLEILALHNRFQMEHDVTYVDVVWDTTTYDARWIRREERNEDRTNTWGLHLGYDRPVGDAGWRVGGILTGNYKTHPKIPNYQIMNIPRDPGDTWAYNLGAGIARETGAATVGLDLVYEPIWSSTWADAASDTTANGRTILAGGKLIENEFTFRNIILRAGIGREGERYGVQMGLRARSIGYRLEQRDNLADSDRRQRESWMEWTPSWGGAIRFPEFEIRYAGRWTAGTGRPGVQTFVFGVRDAFALSTFLPAPSGPLTLREADVITHRLVITMPIH